MGRDYLDRKRIAEEQGLCYSCQQPTDRPTKLQCTKCTLRTVQRARERADRLREKIHAHYGALCACCGETNKDFLTIDHVNNDGAAHRRRLHNGRRTGDPKPMLYDIIKQGFPNWIQILCFNCNCGRERNGGICPHKCASVDP